MTHHLTLTRTSPTHRACCSCGWESVAYPTITGAHMAFGIHLIAPTTERDAS